MPLNPEELAKAENTKHAEQLETSMLVMATVFLRKLGRKRIAITQADIQEAVSAGLAEVRDLPDDADAVVYELPSKKKPRS